MNEKWKQILTDKIPEDRYEIAETSTKGDKFFKVLLEGETYQVEIDFGYVDGIRYFDESNRLRTYHGITEIKDYIEKGFFGNPFYQVYENSELLKWLSFEFTGLENSDADLYLSHLLIITFNDVIDVVNLFSNNLPNVKVTKLR